VAWREFGVVLFVNLAWPWFHGGAGGAARLLDRSGVVGRPRADAKAASVADDMALDGAPPANGQGVPMGTSNQAALTGPSVSDEDLHKLAKTPKLEWLDLSRSEVTDRGLTYLTRFQELRSLAVTGCHQITDRGLAELARLPHLRELYLSGTRITDNGLAQLHILGTLEVVDVRGTGVSREGVEALQKAVPGVAITHFILNERGAAIWALAAVGVLVIAAYCIGRRRTGVFWRHRLLASGVVTLAAVKLTTAALLLVVSGLAVYGVAFALGTSYLSVSATTRWAHKCAHGLLRRLALAIALFVVDIVLFVSLMVMYDRILFWGVPVRP